MEKKLQIVVPEYMKQFSCIGPDCEDTCCAGWNTVSIDKQTFEQYSAVEDGELKDLVSKNVVINDDTSDPTCYANIKQGQDLVCPFLTTERLCIIQQKLGEPALSYICSVYPRVPNIVQGVIERSATLSCPEAARLALLNPDGISFGVQEIPHGRWSHIAANVIGFPNEEGVSTVRGNYWELRNVSIKLLQNRKFSIAERLLILGLFCRRIQEILDGQSSETLADAIEAYKEIPYEQAKAGLKQFPVVTDVQLGLLFEIAQMNYLRGVTTKRYLECYEEFLKGLEYRPGLGMSKLIKNYKRAYSKYYQPFMQSHEYILENYLVNHVFRNLFPCGGKFSVYEEYIFLVLLFSLTKLHLIGMSGYHKGLNLELVVKLIQSFAKSYEHNPVYAETILESMKKSNYSSLKVMVMLIKN